MVDERNSLTRRSVGPDGDISISPPSPPRPPAACPSVRTSKREVQTPPFTWLPSSQPPSGETTR
jgi:hypothetical protein